MAQMGQTSPNVALARAMDRRDGQPERLAALVGRRYRATTVDRALPDAEREQVKWSEAA